MFTHDDLHHLPAGSDGPALYWFEAPVLADHPGAFPGCRHHWDVEAALKRAGVIGPADRAESEPDVLVVNFPDEWAGFAFLRRLTTYISENTAGIHAGRPFCRC